MNHSIRPLTDINLLWINKVGGLGITTYEELDDCYSIVQAKIME